LLPRLPLSRATVSAHGWDALLSAIIDARFGSSGQLVASSIDAHGISITYTRPEKGDVLFYDRPSACRDKRLVCYVSSVRNKHVPLNVDYFYDSFLGVVEG
jgi:hypothetical protein